MLSAASLIIPCWKWTVPLSFGKEKQLCCEKPFFCLKKNNLCCENSVCCLVEEWFLFCKYWWHHWWCPFWKRTMPLSFIFVMGNRPMNSNLCLEIFLQPCIGDYSGAYFRACSCDWFAIVCVVKCVPSWKHAWCLRWRIGQILAASGMPLVLCDKLLGRQIWLRLGCLTMDCC